MYKSTAKALTAVHDVFVIAALALTLVTFFLRKTPFSELSAIWVAVFLLWLAFCVWSLWKALSALVRGGGGRTANFEALMERRVQEGGSPAGGLWAMTLVTGILRLVIPILLTLV